MKESTLNVLLPGCGSHRRWSGLRMREEIARYAPAILLLKRGNRCCEISVDLFFELLRESGQPMRGIPWDVTVPRRGFIILVPRIPGHRRSRRTTCAEVSTGID